MANKTFILLCFFPNFILGQIKSIVLDSVTNKPIEYANIWIENNENIGISTDKNGEFELTKYYLNKPLVISALGYEKKVSKLNSKRNEIRLKPMPYILDEVLIKSNKKKNTLKLGYVKKSKIKGYFGSANTSWMLARYFPYSEDYQEAKYLKSIKIVTKSKINNAKFRIRLYEGDRNNQPEKPIYNKNIIGLSKKGKTYTEIDLSNLHIIFPENGVFVVVEWLPIKENAYTFSLKIRGEKYSETYFEPMFGIMHGKSENNSWIFSKGKWEKIRKIKRRENKIIYKYIPMELTLTN